MQIPPGGNKCVAFLGDRTTGVFRPRATAFFVSYDYKQFTWYAVVTAEHVVSQLRLSGYEIWMRVNTVDGDVLEVPLPHDAWRFYPDDRNLSDVAVCPMSPPSAVVRDDGKPVALDILVVALNGKDGQLATKELIEERQIGVGDEVISIGLFRSHFGRGRNIPIVRTGNIATLLDEPVETRYCGFTDAYLIETRSIGGLSGSPVFVNLPAWRAIDGSWKFQAGQRQVHLLGLMHGHFDVTDMNSDVAEDAIAKGLNSIHTGIGIVIPVEKIVSTMEHPDFIEIRDRLVAQSREEAGAVPDIASAMPEDAS